VSLYIILSKRHKFASGLIEIRYRKKRYVHESWLW